MTRRTATVKELEFAIEQIKSPRLKLTGGTKRDTVARLEAKLETARGKYSAQVESAARASRLRYERLEDS